MEKLVNTIKLMAKTGLFFASCDGDYSQHERDFINAFLNSILSVGDIDESLQNEVNDSLKRSFSLEEIIQETRQLVDGFNEDERKAILLTMSAFVQKVISADERMDSQERANYAKWKEAVGA